jgi:hypothetical protein
MTMKSSSKPSQWRSKLLALTAVLAMAAPALPQAASAGANAAHPNIEGAYSSWDIGGFFGTQWYQMWEGNSIPRPSKLLIRPVVGVRAGQLIGNHFGIDEIFDVAFNKLALLPTGGTAYAEVGARNYQFAVVGVGYFTPRTSRIRPYVEFGPTGVVYQPYRANASNIHQPPPGNVQAIIPAALRTKVEPGFTYGLGIKMPLASRWDARVDLRGQWTPEPDYGLPGQPGVPGTLWVNTHHGLSGLQLTGGVAYRLGIHEPPPPPTCAAGTVGTYPDCKTPCPPGMVGDFQPNCKAPVPTLTISNIQGAPAAACPGDNVRLTVTSTGGPADATPTYQWFVNGQPAPGGTGATFNLPTANQTVPQLVRVTVTSGGSTAQSNTITVTMRPSGPPTIRFTVNPTTINYGDRLPLNATATGSECTNPVTIRYTASEGTIANNTFDSTGVSFDPTNTRQQTKVVRLTAIATDAKGQTATATADVTILRKAVASRQDIVFANRSPRVNNAAKRYLIEQLTPRLRDDPGATVILIGHRDASETGRAAATLDRDRVLNTAAVISAGKGVCPSLDLSRVQVAYAGTDQTDPPMPFGDASVKERAGQTATDAQSQFRRVEVWFIPSGADRPTVNGVMPAPVREIQAKGCPR